jgi:hypothetical protein
MLTSLISPLLILFFTSCEREEQIVFPQSYTYQSVGVATAVEYYSTTGSAIGTLNSATSLNNFIVKATDEASVLYEIIPISKIELLSDSKAKLSNTIQDNSLFGLQVNASYVRSGSVFEFLSDSTSIKSSTTLAGNDMQERVMCFSYTKTSSGKTTASVPNFLFTYDSNPGKVVQLIKSNYGLGVTDTVAITYFDLIFPRD